MATDTFDTRANGEGSISQNGPLNASELFQKHEEAKPHNPTVEDIIDEEDIAHPPPSSLESPKPGQTQASRTTKLDTQSEEAFPSLGAGPKSKAPANAPPSWGVRKTAPTPKSAVNGKANGNSKAPQVVSPPPSRGSTPASGNLTPAFAAPNPQQSPYGSGPFTMSMPGKTTREYQLRAEHMSKDKSLTPLIHDINRKLKVKINRLEGPGIITFQATGAPHAVEQALQQIAAQASAKVTDKIPIPAAARRHVIGAGGGTVKAIMAKSGARIQLPKAVEDEDDSTVVEVQVEGNGHSVEVARREIEQIVAEHAAKVNLQMREVPPEFFPFIAGPKNRNLDRFSGQNVNVHVPQYHNWTHRAPPTVSHPGERPDFAPHPGQSIQISGERLVAYQAKAQIEREIERLRNELAVHEEYFAPGKPQFVFGDKGMSLHDFLEETGCAVVLPGPNSKDSETVTIIGPPNQLQLGIDKAINLAADVQSENLSLGRYHASAPQGADAHARNLTRYLQKRELIREIEKASNSHIVPSSVDGPVIWNIFSRDGRNMHQARGDIIKIVEAHPPSRISQVNVDPFFHPHIEEQFSRPMQEELHVHVVLPEDDVEHLVLVYEGPAGLDERFQAPKQRPSPQELALFQEKLEQAQNRIFDLIRDHDRIVSSTVPAPRKYHDKLRRYVDRRQQSGPPQAFPVQLQFGGAKAAGRTVAQLPAPATIPSENDVVLRGPNQYVEELKSLILAFIEQQEKEEIERGYTISFPFPQKFVSQLVGREGSNINKMREEFDVEITPSNDQVTIKGPQAKAERCKAHIISLGKKLEDEESLVIKVPARFHADMIGPGGKTVRRLEEKYLVRVQFPRNTASDAASIADGVSEVGGRRNGRPLQGADEITIRGPRKGAQEVRSELLDLKQYLEDHSFIETVSVARPQVRLLMGKGGRDMELLRQETGAKIDVPNGQSKDDSGRVDFKLSGTKADVLKAKKILLEKTKSFDDIVTRSVEVDRKYYKDLIGVRGANIQRIVIAAGGTEKDAHAVKFPDQREESTSIKVSGPDDLVTRIIDSIKSFVSTRANQITDSIEVPVAKRGQLIGREGRIRQGIENDFIVSVNIPKAGNQTTAVEISGSAENVAKAKAHIATLIKDQAGETVIIPCSIHHTIADRGALFRRLRNDHQVTVDHSGQKPPPRPSTPLTNSGRPTNPSASSATLPLITDDPSTINPTETYSWDLVSTNAANGDETSTSTIPWVLSGPSPEAIGTAKSLIERAVERASKPSTTGYLILPDTSTFGAIIGPGGRKINEIRRETGCEVQVPNARSGGAGKEAIEVRGTEEGCEKAKKMILEAVRNGGNAGGRRR